MVLHQLAAVDYVGLGLNLLVIIIFAQRIFRKTPRNCDFGSWNRPKQYEFIAFLSVIVNQAMDFIVTACQPVPLYVDNEGAEHSLGNHESFGIIANLALWSAVTCLVFASLYRFERLLTVLRGSRSYTVLQILRGSMLSLASITIYAYLHNLFFDDGVIPNKNQSPFYRTLHTFNGVSSFVTMVYAGAIDLISNLLMTQAVLYSLPRRINKPSRYLFFTRKLIGLIVSEVLITIVAGALYALSALGKLYVGYIHLSILAICPVYVSLFLRVKISFCLLEILREYIRQGEHKAPVPITVLSTVEPISLESKLQGCSDSF